MGDLVLWASARAVGGEGGVTSQYSDITSLTPSLSPDLRNPELASPFRSDSPVPTAPTLSTAARELATDPELEKKLLHHLSDLGLALPTDALSICLAISTVRARSLPLAAGPMGPSPIPLHHPSM